MRDWKKVLVKPQDSILKVIELIDNSSMQIALVVDEYNHLLGTVTDGDIRRAILRGVSLNEFVETIMNSKPRAAKVHEDREKILEIMRREVFSHMPIVDDDNKVIALEFLNDLIRPAKKENWVVLMAGGLGSRLVPLTNDCPKPLLQVGDKPILETIIQNFIEQGFSKFYISVNYKAQMIEKYFGNGEKWNITIEYLRENERLGTAGALSLLPYQPTAPMIIMNGDLLTRINFQHLLDFHMEAGAFGTMCVRDYKFQVPYGVVQLEKQRLVGIVEKPIQQFFVSAGVYVLNPEALTFIPVNRYFDMPSLFEKMMHKGLESVAFPVREYWIDIGRIGDFEKANGEYYEVFK